jgi:predicted TIM-barrel fold metal-dependent hydrolase
MGRVAQLVTTAVERYHFVGIKVHQHDGRITRELLEVARRFALPVLYDVMGEVTIVDMIAREYPEVSFIIPHLGSFADDYRAQMALIDLLVRFPNVHADTAGVRRFDVLEEAVARAGARKVLFGSDGPWLHPGIELAKIRELHLRPEAERLITGGNLVRLIGARGARLLHRAEPGAPPRRALHRLEPRRPRRAAPPST